MTHSVHSLAHVALRVTSGLVAATCFYLAIFLYEGEDGKIQNRIDGLWKSIYERSRVTGSTSTALFNKIAEKIGSFMSQLLGDRIISFRSASVTFNLSICSLTLVRTLEIRDWGFGVSVIAVYLAFAMLPVLWKSGIAVATSCVPLVVSAWFAIKIHLDAPTLDRFAELEPFVYLSSMFSDFLAIAVTRRILTNVESTLSFRKILEGLFAIMCVVLLVVGVPFEFRWYRLPTGPYGEPANFLEFVAGASDRLFLMNLPTLFVSLLPAALLAVVVSDRLAWPLLSRLIGPLSRFKVVTNRKALITIGSFSLAVALNGLQAIKDHLK